MFVTSPCGSPDKKRSEGKIHFVASLPLFRWQVHMYSTCHHCYYNLFLLVQPSILYVLKWTKDSWLSRNPPGLQQQTRAAEASLLVDWASTRLSACPVSGEPSLDYSYSISQSNKFPFNMYSFCLILFSREYLLNPLTEPQGGTTLNPCITLESSCMRTYLL